MIITTHLVYLTLGYHVILIKDGYLFIAEIV